MPNYFILFAYKEWKGFYDELYDALEQQMRENKVQSFASLSEPEQNLLLGKALQSIQGGAQRISEISFYNKLNCLR